MTKWYEEGYPGGAMIPVPGFPRAVYAPDDPGHPNPQNGSDIVAYKRIVSRAGRWPWSMFNNHYTNEFAHGRPGGNVGDSGIAGLQRQLGIQPTGNVGQTTFNAMRSIRIPAGLPHAGQPAMDPNAQTLIADAYKYFHRPPPPKLTKRQMALASAQTFIGTKESPYGSNRQLFGAWYYMNGVAWCAIFASYCFVVGAGDTRTFKRGARYSYCPTIAYEATKRMNGLSLTSAPIPGDLVLYDWDGGGFDHVGIFESGNSQKWTAVEGNTSGRSFSNGGTVARCVRYRSTPRYVAFVRVAD